MSDELVDRNKYFKEAAKAGRPYFWENPVLLQIAVEEYFEYISGRYEETQELLSEKADGTKVYVTDLKCIRSPEAPTITGLALFLGFTGRKALYDYKNDTKPERKLISDVVKAAMTRVEMSYEMGLRTNSAVGSIFALKNMGWADNIKQEINTNRFNVEISDDE